MVAYNFSEVLASEVSTFSILTLLLSIFAIIISILGYLDNKKNLKINEQNLGLVMEKQKQKVEFEFLLKALKETSDKLKSTPRYIYFAFLDEFILSITRDVYENNKLILSFNFTYLDYKKKIAINTIKNEDDIVQLIKQHSTALKNENILYGVTLHFQTNLKTNMSEWFDISDIFCGFSNLEEIIEDLKHFDFLLESFDPGLIDAINQNYHDLRSLFYEGLNATIDNYEFNRDMKPSDIENYIHEALNYKQMLDKAEYMSTDLRKRVDNLKKEIAIHVLAK